MDGFILYHVIYQKSVFKNLQGISIFHSKIMPKLDHVHVIAVSKKPIIPEPGMRFEPIANKRQYYYIAKNLIYSSKVLHDFVCEVTFSVHSLKDLCIKKVLCCLSDVHARNQLNCPKPLLDELYYQSKSHFYLPEWSGTTYPDEVNISQIDCVYKKDYVVWIQGAIELYSRSFCLVYFYFNHIGTANLCLKCMQFEVPYGSYQRIYTLECHNSIWYINYFVQNPRNWCHTCKQVPLFQILTYPEVEEQYEFKHGSNGNYCETIVKKDYFEDGIKVRSQFFLSKEAFGGIHHSYLI